MESILVARTTTTTTTPATARITPSPSTPRR
jgi:hypothetical protein